MFLEKHLSGKRLLRLVPNKTLSGALGSFIFSFIFFIHFENVSFYIKCIYPIFRTKVFLCLIIFSLVAQIGDLIISYFKRLEDVKDTGKILPGHGGIFDRIDGLMFVVILASSFNSIYYNSLMKKKIAILGSTGSIGNLL